jgi:hypothetical protein
MNMRSAIAIQKFVRVIEGIDNSVYPDAYRKAFAVPLSFYYEHEVCECIRILTAKEGAVC